MRTYICIGMLLCGLMPAAHLQPSDGDAWYYRVYGSTTRPDDTNAATKRAKRAIALSVVGIVVLVALSCAFFGRGIRLLKKSIIKARRKKLIGILLAASAVAPLGLLIWAIYALQFFNTNMAVHTVDGAEHWSVVQTS